MTRLDKLLVQSGLYSRSDARALIRSGSVAVNGVTVDKPETKADESAVITVLGAQVNCAEYRYFMLDKPAGVLSATEDPGQPTVLDLLPRELRALGLSPVGRLDKDTTGLLLFTTDGDLGQALLHPSRHVEKHYVALVSGTPSEADLDRLRRGIMLDDGPAAPAKARLIGPEERSFSTVAPHGAGRTGGGEPNAVVGLTIHEGRKHQVKKMMLAIGHRVLALHRDAFGPVRLGGVREGEWREVTEAERAELDRICTRTRRDHDRSH